MTEIDAALCRWLVKQGFPPKICYTCAEETTRKTRRGRRYGYCDKNNCAVGQQDNCSAWSLREA